MLALMKSLTQSFLGKLIAMFIIVGMAVWGADRVVNQIRTGLGSNLIAAGDQAVDMTTLDHRVEILLKNLNAQSKEPVSKEDLAKLMKDMEAGSVSTLIVWGCNPVYDLPVVLWNELSSGCAWVA